MKIEQIYTGCLAEAAYYIESDGEAAIIDPLRETAPYIDRANEDDAKIKYILETHFHADFVSGHVDLAALTGAEIVYGPTAKANFPIHLATDGEILKLGKISIKVLHTPGHTMESTCFLLMDEAGNPHALFSGDTLFINEVGRPDLAVSKDTSREDLAGFLFDSLQNKILPLPDDVIVYPGHGAGSACGKNIGKELVDSLGHQKRTNYALRPELTKQQFIDEVLNGILPPPQYFPKNAQLNKSGYGSFESVLANGSKPLHLAEFEQAMDKGALVIDTRNKDAFAEGHIPGSIFIGIEGDFAPWVGIVIENLQQPIVLVAEPSRVEEIVTRLARVGYDNCLGYLEGGFDAWRSGGMEIASVNRIPASGLENALQQHPKPVLDLRRFAEFNGGHLGMALNHPLDYLLKSMLTLDKSQGYYVHCKSGYRSMIGASILMASGFHGITDIAGGWDALEKTALVPKADLA
ncbi:MAG: MBL fold metallo-hydrolase [Bacteroidetes bacterium]|nr:MBL fold metallo-hydrolase [Bacteroidota bacterium]